MARSATGYTIPRWRVAFKVLMKLENSIKVLIRSILFYFFVLFETSIYMSVQEQISLGKIITASFK